MRKPLPYPPAKGTKREGVVCLCHPWRSPSPERRVVDFPHRVSQLGVCVSNFPIEHTLPSRGRSSGAHSCLENLLLPLLGLFVN